MEQTIIPRETLIFAVGLIVAFPIAMLILSEVLIRLERSGQPLTSTLRIVRNLVLPTLAFWILIRYLIGYGAESTPSKLALTTLWIALIHASLSLINEVVFTGAEEGSWQSRLPRLFIDLFRMIMVLLGASIVLSTVWSYDLGNLVAALGVGSIVIGLALQEPLGNVFAGLFLLFERPFSLGDWIEIDGMTGKITEINWRAVHIVTLDVLVVIPNSQLYKSTFRNRSRPTKHATEVLELGFSYDDPPNKVKRILRDALQKTGGVLKDPAPKVQTFAYLDFSIGYRIIFMVDRQEHLPDVRDDFMTRVWYATRRHGLTMPFPTQMQVRVEPPNADAKHQLPAASVSQSFPQLGLKDLSSLGDLVKTFELKDFAKGEPIHTEGDSLDGFYLILEGQVSMSVRDGDGKDREIANLGRGDFFGEASLHSGAISEVSVTALEDLHALVIDHVNLQAMVERAPRLAREIGAAMDVRRKAANSARKIRGPAVR